MLVDKIGQRKNPSVLGKVLRQVNMLPKENDPNVSFTKILWKGKTNDSV